MTNMNLLLCELKRYVSVLHARNELFISMVFKNDGKSLIQHGERVDKSSLQRLKNGPFGREAYGQTVFPDWSILVGQKLVENAKIKQFNF